MTPPKLAIAVVIAVAVARAPSRHPSHPRLVADAFSPPPLFPSFSTLRGGPPRCRLRRLRRRRRDRYDGGDHRPLLSNIVDDDDDDDDDGGGGEEEEWRSFRARLVRDGLPSLGDVVVGRPRDNDDDDDDVRPPNRYAHETTPLVEVGSILLSIPTPDLCQALEQQYWHRAVVLITHVSENAAVGEAFEDAVPDDQLARGDRRGRWSYRGVLLNRALLRGGSDDDASSSAAEEGLDDDDGGRRRWGARQQWGGDLLGIDSFDGTEEALLCLHHHPDDRAASDDDRSNDQTEKLVGRLSITTPAHVGRLCRNNAKTSSRLTPGDDVVLFAGFCSWRPGQLEIEMSEDRDEWRVLSVDGRSSWDEVMSQRRKILSSSSTIAANDDGDGADATGSSSGASLRAGTEMWTNFLGMIGMSESAATGRLSPGQVDFYDGMLEVWAEDRLNNEEVVDAAPPSSSSDILAVGIIDPAGRIGPGTIARARSPPTNDMLLYDAEFVRSLILVLEDTRESTVGVILSHPMAAAIEFKDGEDPIPIRYGGPIDVVSWKDGSYLEEGGDGDDDEVDDELHEEFFDYRSEGINSDDEAFVDCSDSIDDDHDDDYDDDSSFIWIHRNAEFGCGGGGTRLGTSGLWLVEEDDAIESLKTGILRMEEVMVFSGVSIWEKGPDLGRCNGGLLEQIDSLRSLEVVQSCDSRRDADAIGIAWGILTKRQRVLTRDSLDSNIDAAISAWTECCAETAVGSTVSRRDDARARLSDATLKAWVGANLLGDPLGTVVEVSGQRL